MSQRAIGNVVGVLLIVLGLCQHFSGAAVLPIVPDRLDPIPGDGFRVLVVYESEQLKDYPRAQVDALYSSDVRAYLDAKCVAGQSGWPDYRILDKDADLSLDATWWQEAMKRPRQSLPWIVVDSPQGGFEGPLPVTVDATLELLKKYGGA